MLDPAPYPTEEPAYERPRAAPHRERTSPMEGFVPVRLVLGVLLVLFGVLVIVDPRLLVWIVGFGLVALGVWLLFMGGYLGRPKPELKPAEPPAWRP